MATGINKGQGAAIAVMILTAIAVIVYLMIDKKRKDKEAATSFENTPFTGWGSLDEYDLLNLAKN